MQLLYHLCFACCGQSYSVTGFQLTETASSVIGFIGDSLSHVFTCYLAPHSAAPMHEYSVVSVTLCVCVCVCVCVRLSVCLCVRALRAKRFELSTPNLAHTQFMGIMAAASSANKTRNHPEMVDDMSRVILNLRPCCLRS